MTPPRPTRFWSVASEFKRPEPSLSVQLTVLGHVCSMLLNRRMAEGLSLLQIRILYSLADVTVDAHSDIGCSVNVLAALLIAERPQVSKHLRLLKDRHFVRLASPGSRSSGYTLTAKGIAALKKIEKNVSAIDKHILKTLNAKDGDYLASRLGRILKAMEGSSVVSHDVY